MSKRHFGTVRQRSSGRWQALYFFDGKTHSAGTFKTKADALVFLSTIDTDLHRGSWIDPKSGKVTLDEYAERWLAQRTELAFRTRELYDYLLELHILPTLGRTTLVNLAPSTIRTWHANLSDPSLDRREVISPLVRNPANSGGRRTPGLLTLQGQWSRG
jgi:Phage integrase, N-terminal SAM-like domain